MKKELLPVQWSSSLASLRDEVSTTFSRWVSRLRREKEMSLSGTSNADWPGWNGPSVDVEDEGSDIVVTVELPGMDKKDFSVDLDRQKLVIRGEKRNSRKEKGKGYQYTECSYGAFHRAVPLPCEVAEDRVQATYKKGVLKVKLPKMASAAGRQIPVNVGR
ncbi:MAG: Hsp20/alpha crystallin family protein [Candidatus Omnitrophica bacterium]|nr:Hsp20/alpha crystallin family protein [Candidatus Omnitrophota bacterium]